MDDLRIEQVDGALRALDQGDLQLKVALWQWAYLEMLHETLTGMHQLSHRVGVAELVADAWLAPVDVIAPEQPFLDRATLADQRLQAFAVVLGNAPSRESRASLWRSGYADAIRATLHGMHTLAGKHQIERQTAGRWLSA